MRIVQRHRRADRAAPTTGRAAASWSAKHSRTRPSRAPSAAGADPHQLAGGAQLVEHRAAVAADAGREHVGLDRRGDERRARTGRRAPRPALPSRDARPGCCARPAGSGRTPAARPARPRAAATPAIAAAAGAARRRRSTRATTPSGRNSPSTIRPSASSATIAPVIRSLRRTEAAGDVGDHERAVGAGVAADQLLQRPGDRLGERHREPERQRAPERVAVAGGVLARGVPHLAADADLDRPLLGEQRLEPASERPVAPHRRDRTSTARTAGRSRRATGRRPDAARRAARRPSAPGGRRRGTAARARRRRARRRRAARAAPRRRADRAAGRDRARAPRPAVRRAVHRPRTCTRRSS